jgi:integrase/recombinase XerD
MAVTAVRLTRSRNGAGELVVRLGVPLLDEYLRRVRPVDVPVHDGAAHGRGRPAAGRGTGRQRVSARTLRRRLSSVAGLHGFLHARGDVSVNPVPRGLPTRRERQRPGQGVPPVRVPRTLP